MKLKEELKEKFNIPEENFHRYQQDLFVLWTEPIEKHLIDIGQFYEILRSDVEDQEWFGQRFIEIPFYYIQDYITCPYIPEGFDFSKQKQPEVSSGNIIQKELYKF